jgi:hypothetical protein
MFLLKGDLDLLTIGKLAGLSPVVLSKISHLTIDDYDVFNRILVDHLILIPRPQIPLRYTSNGYPQIARLGFKQEPGKLRVFAMVDCWTQMLLYPLHRLIFKILGSIPMDGTFNQYAPLKRLLRRVKASKLPLYSLDLSAATDRLPVYLQALLLNAWIGNNFGM